ncbi:gliding motility protein RemB [Sphingobacterium corticibacter]|uniref:Gliding motility protein RemB n=1 Tax=Sphingobacterium corticibacter TaxID=2171749 RepID=A0A2T8HGZ1_9SPHI|nr:gliding motility protein RemB [Sphingobacterium corticibacter]PVH24582.1 gliding motility protein RemB [Sphingobacterium corticibacter]
MKISHGLILALGCLGFALPARAQIDYLPYSYSLYQQYGETLYGADSREFTTVKPLLLKKRLFAAHDSITNLNRTNSDNWFARKLFNEHLVEANGEDYRFYADFIPDLMIGSDLRNSDRRNVWLGSAGVQAGFAYKDKFVFYGNLIDNRAVFPNYLTDYINTNEVVPGQGVLQSSNGERQSWLFATANATYAFGDYFQASVGYDRNHIGDGYRSVLLSDFSSNYAQLRLTGTIGNVRYTSVWAYMNDPRTARIDSLNSGAEFGDGKKWGAFQYLDYNISNRLSVGFFQAVIWANRNQAGRRGFDWNYAIPINFLRPIESNNSSSPDKMFLGASAKYKTWENITLYSQFLLGEFTGSEFFAGNGYIHNKWAAQFGARGYHMFGVRNLSLLAEYNLARPYTYQHFVSISNYSNNAEPLAHPRGANFKEVVGIANYAWRRFHFSLQGMYSLFGTDPGDGTSYGGDIFESYENYPNWYGNSIGQGIRNDLYFADVRASYVLNPTYNLRFELGYTHRQQNIADRPSIRTGVISVGLRSTFRPFYGDI